ncbi:hypothetical protein [Pedobacter jejuensis]|uniref:Uncharacterized protein n=1 Tax=Pedobacter jejuensis TaxID=1268550 RepID=A0A3N0BM28_9SPHI|nr:hypothetical protein [Pedobacter jejuensis]RNL49765.1 hypothetical protein D7004_20375 [Pedobacter jejuensis]
MFISFDKSKLSEALSGISEEFREQIIDVYIEIKKRQVKSFFNDELDTVGLSSGKFCETVFRMIQKEVTGSFTPFDKHISNFPQELTKIIMAPAGAINESLRVIIPRALMFIYTLRNKRGIGHVGGDVEANQIDIGTIVKSVDWVVCELIRIYHNLPLEKAQLIVDSLNLKILPDLWNIDGKRRVLKSGLKFKEKIILLLYNELKNKASLEELFEWSEHSNKSTFKSSIINGLHKEKLIEFNKNTSEVSISPTGLALAESLIINQS